jgi:hypothetical protein
MINKLFDFIGTELKAVNPYIDTYSVNNIQDREGRILFDFFKENDYNGIQDMTGKSFYIRYAGRISYNDAPRRSSCAPFLIVSIPSRIVFFNFDEVNKFDTFALEQKIRSDIKNINFSNYQGPEEKITLALQGSDIDYRQIYVREFGVIPEGAKQFTGLLIDFTLKFSVAPGRIAKCEEECNIFIDQTQTC